MNYTEETSLSSFWTHLFHLLYSLWKLADDWRPQFWHNILNVQMISHKFTSHFWQWGVKI